MRPDENSQKPVLLSKEHELAGFNCGKALLRDALLRALAGSEAIGGRAFLVHAKDEDARNFYSSSSNFCFTVLVRK